MLVVMTRTFEAEFDGRVLTPTEAVDLPRGCRLRVTADEGADEASSLAAEEHDQPDVARGTLADLFDWIDTLPPIDRGDLPTDGSKNYKHYLYGQTKQP